MTNIFGLFFFFKMVYHQVKKKSHWNDEYKEGGNRGRIELIFTWWIVVTILVPLCP